MKTNVRTQYRKGFTLIELLVVIMIIAILAAILFPVFSKAREKARQATCTSNQKQIALAVTMYMNEHETILPDGNWTRAIGMEDSKMLKCPSATLDNSDCYYIFNILIAGKKMSAITTCDPTEMWMTADGITGEVTSLEKGDWRHNEMIIMSWLDGHVSYVEGTMMDYYRKVGNVSEVPNLTMTGTPMFFPKFYNPGGEIYYQGGDAWMGSTVAIFNAEGKKVYSMSDYSPDNYTMAFDRNSGRVAIMANVGGYVYMTTLDKLKKAVATNTPISVTKADCKQYASGSWDMFFSEDGSLNYQNGGPPNLLTSVNMETGKIFDVLELGANSSDMAYGMDMIVFNEGNMDMSPNGEIYMGQYSALVKKAKELGRSLGRDEAIGLGLVQVVATGFKDGGGTVLQMNMNQNGDVYCSKKTMMGGADAVGYMIRGCTLYSVFKGQRAPVTPADAMRVIYSLTPDPARDDFFGMPAFFVGKNLYIGYEDGSYSGTYKFKMYHGE